MGKRKQSNYMGLGGIIAGAMVASSIRSFAQDIVDKKVEIKVSFERKKKGKGSQ